MNTTTSTGVHQASTRMDFPEVAAQLNTHLGPTLVALLAGITDRKTPGRWASGAVEPRLPAERRVRAAHRAWA